MSQRTLTTQLTDRPSLAKNVLLDTEFGDEEYVHEIDFEDLIEQEDIDPEQSGSYLKVSSDHMKSISKVHIKLQLITQGVIIILLLISYIFLPLLEIDDPNPETSGWKVDTAWIKVFKVMTPAGNEYWYWQARFNDSITCASE